FSSMAISAVGKAAMDMVREVRRQFKEIKGIMEGKAKPEYEKCVAISTQASIREMIMPGALALLSPIIVGFLFGPEALGGLLAGITVSGVLMGIFQNNAGGAWDNAKKSFEKGVEIDGQMYYKHKSDKPSPPHQAAVTGDTVGDPFKDTSGPSMNILIKLTSIVALIIAPHINEGDHAAPAEVPTSTSSTDRSQNSSDGSVAPGKQEAATDVKTLDLSDRF
ncbi:MAG TPA: sodium/proton-translocating pyrophosphatase, partial [Flavobacteriales bacterium]|nr:sodium/proton-translocating pyrophosphatase [Flavobacteriales bacterium]